MPKLKRLRTLAFQAQAGLCCYCGARMWLACPDELGMRQRSAGLFQCTAEHLVARQDGGGITRENIAAACWWCNQRRHKRKKQVSPSDYAALVRQRVARGKWWPGSPPGER